MPDFDVFSLLEYESVNLDLMVKGRKEMTNVKDVPHRNLTLAFMTYQLS